MGLLKRLLLALLNGIIVIVVLGIIAAILMLIHLELIAGTIAPWIFPIAVLVGALTFLGMIPNYWEKISQ